MLPKSKIILSGMQPTAELHLGNYLGALKNWVMLQADNRCFFMIADLHAITVPYQPKMLEKKVLELAVDFLATGVDPEKSILFLQSQIPEHTELMWLLNTITPVGELQRMTQFKDKAEQHQEALNAGLLNYPILMTADILLYKPDLIPVGDDQTQHVELTRTIVRKFNSTFGEYFEEPKVYEATVPRVMSLLEPTQKMSKSSGAGHCLFLADEPELIRKKISKAVTDEGGGADKTITGGRNLIQLFKVLSDDKPLKQRLDDEHRAGELKYSEFKPLLADTIIKLLEPIQTKRKELLAKPKEVEKILRAGRDQARLIAGKTLSEVKEKMGLI